MTQPRMLPHNRHAEHAVVGGILLSPVHGLPAALEAGLKVDDFYAPAPRAVFQAMLILAERSIEITVITLIDQLERTAQDQLVGGIEGLAKMDRHASPLAIGRHATMVIETARVRQMVVTCREIAEEGMETIEDEPLEWLADAEARVFALRRGHGAGPQRVSSGLSRVFGLIQSSAERGADFVGAPTGLTDLDDLTLGLRPSHLAVVAGRPSHGKTALMLGIIVHLACGPKAEPCLFFSLEMSFEDVVLRMIAKLARIDLRQIYRGDLSRTEFVDIIAACERLMQAPIWIDDSAALAISEIRARARRWCSENVTFDEEEQRNLGEILIDYAQLARGGKKNYDVREQEVSEISRGSKALAKETKLPVVLASQLNRAVDIRSDHRPQLSDLRESGALEQDADVVMFVYQPSRYLQPGTPEHDEALSHNRVIVGKQRNGPIGDVQLTFVQKYASWENRAPSEMELGL